MLRNDPQERHLLRGTLLKTSRGKMLVTYSILPMIGITFWWQMFRARFQWSDSNICILRFKR